MSMMPRFIPDAECVQSKCANATTGCRDVCMMRNPGWVVAAPLPAAPAPTEKADSLCTLTDAEIADPEFVRTYIESHLDSFDSAMREIARLRLAARQAPTGAPKERAINDWLALTIRNTAFAEAAELFPQPYMEYFGENIQATIRAQISQYAQPNLRPTLSNEDIDRITSRFKQVDHHDSIRACIAAVFAQEKAQ